MPSSAKGISRFSSRFSEGSLTPPPFIFQTKRLYYFSIIRLNLILKKNQSINKKKIEEKKQQ